MAQVRHALPAGAIAPLPATVLTLALTFLFAPAGPAQARTSGARLDRAERALLREINRVRIRSGLHRLSRSRRLQRSADYHCWDMLRANFFAHTSSNGTPFDRRVRRYVRPRRLGENLAYLPSRSARGGARRVVAMWLASPPHREALLSPGFRRVGVARRIGRLGAARVAVYTADFASRR